jgi:hypothetical protein
LARLSHKGKESIKEFRRMVTTAVDLKIEMPDSLAKEAGEAGLLTSDSIQALLVQELQRRRQAADFFAVLQRLHEAGLPPMTEEEIEAEIHAARAERRASLARRV